MWHGLCPQRPVSSAPRQLLWCPHQRRVPPIARSGPGQGYVWWWPGGGILDGSALTGASKSEDELEEGKVCQGAGHSLRRGHLDSERACPSTLAYLFFPPVPCHPAQAQVWQQGVWPPSELSQAPALEQSWGQAKGSRLQWKRNFRTDTSCGGRPRWLREKRKEQVIVPLQHREMELTAHGCA